MKDYTGDTINGATMQPTRLFADHQAGKITGFNGGWDNALKIGLTFDTRDFEPDPASGVMLQAVGRVSRVKHWDRRSTISKSPSARADTTISSAIPDASFWPGV